MTSSWAWVSNTPIPSAKRTFIQAYYAPVGDPALGPVAFPHRASAFELPQATLAHHLQDSTHIAENVATIALKHKWLRLEASGFYGTEPDENRWNFDCGPMNSHSGRMSIFPSKNWMVQVSAGRLYEGHRDISERRGGLGANATAYAIPSAIKPYYGDHPWGVNMYLRFQLKQE